MAQGQNFADKNQELFPGDHTTNLLFSGHLINDPICFHHKTNFYRIRLKFDRRIT